MAAPLNTSVKARRADVTWIASYEAFSTRTRRFRLINFGGSGDARNRTNRFKRPGLFLLRLRSQIWCRGGGSNSTDLLCRRSAITRRQPRHGIKLAPNRGLEPRSFG